MIHRDTILNILARAGVPGATMAEILAEGREVKLVVEDVQFVLRRLIEEKVVKQFPPETDGADASRRSPTDGADASRRSPTGEGGWRYRLAHLGQQELLA